MFYRCGPCKNIAPFVDEMSIKYPNAHFLNVDVDECQETAAAYGVNSMPTFIFMRNKTRLALLKGADKAGLETKIKQFYAESSADEDSGVKGMVKTNKIATNKTEKASSH
jgi:thiol-disulfide isomerase/thioredoxin